MGSYTCQCIQFSYDEDGHGECLCNQGRQGRVCESCDDGAVLVREKYRTFCKEQTTECDIYQQGLRDSSTVDRLKLFPNYGKVTRGYNILRGELVGLSHGVDPGFTSSNIFSVVRKDFRGDSCSFKGYTSDSAKNCEGSSTSEVFTNSSGVIESLEKDFEHEELIDGGEVTIEESENAQFTNSQAFGAELRLNTGNRVNMGTDACVDIELAQSTEIGQTLENNGQSTSTRGSSTERTRGSSIGLKLGGGEGNSFGLSSDIKNEVKDIESESESNILGWGQISKRTDSHRQDINTRFCENFRREDTDNIVEGTDDTITTGGSNGKIVTKSFSIPGFRDSVKNSKSLSQVESHFRNYSGAIALSTKKCTTYKLKTQADNPPTFTEPFKAAIQDLHDLTMGTRSYRLHVVKVGERQFRTTLNSTTERAFDEAFSNFIRLGMVHLIRYSL